MASGMTLNGKEIFESDWIGAADLQGRDALVEIEKVEKAEVFNPKTNKKSYKLALRFKGKVKGFICNRTNATSISKVTGKKEASLWVNQKITLYPTTCKVGRETEPCLRVRETAPSQSSAAQQPALDDTTIQSWLVPLGTCKTKGDLNKLYAEFEPAQGGMSEAEIGAIEAAFARRLGEI